MDIISVEAAFLHHKFPKASCLREMETVLEEKPWQVACSELLTGPSPRHCARLCCLKICCRDMCPVLSSPGLHLEMSVLGRAGIFAP